MVKSDIHYRCQSEGSLWVLNRQPVQQNACSEAKILDRIMSPNRPDGVVVIGVCGMAGAGKTTFCTALTSRFPDRVFRLNCDLFSALSLSERRDRIQSAHGAGDQQRLHIEQNPQNWYDWEGIHTAVDGLRQHRKFSFDKAWNPGTGQLDARYSLELPRSGQVIVLCDCIFLLHDPVCGWFDHTLLVECDDQLIASRREQRSQNAQAEKDARQRQERFERPYFEQHFKPSQIKTRLCLE